MPVPKPNDSAGPRRLLRDVVYEQMRDAIVDGTLYPGERLNDDELVKWLGVSRTPVREAIAKLHAVGLVEVEANRYTRVASRNEEDYREAAQLLAGYHELGEKWGTPLLASSERKSLQKRVQQAAKRLGEHDLEAVGELLDIQGELVRSAGNALFVRTEEPLRLPVKFLTPVDAADVDFEPLTERARLLSDALSPA